MASSKASNHFQNLETRCPSLPQKLQGSRVNFLVLEEDSPDLEDLLCLGLNCCFEVFFKGGLEERSLLEKSFLGFNFCFDLSLDD